MPRSRSGFAYSLEDKQEQPGHQITDQPAGREGQNPGEHHILYNAPVDEGAALRGPDAHDGGGFGMGGADRQAAD